MASQCGVDSTKFLQWHSSVGLFQLSFFQWCSSVHWVIQWHSSGIPVYTGPASVHWLRVRDETVPSPDYLIFMMKISCQETRSLLLKEAHCLPTQVCRLSQMEQEKHLYFKPGVFCLELILVMVILLNKYLQYLYVWDNWSLLMTLIVNEGTLIKTHLSHFASKVT